MDVLIERCAGIDIGKKLIVAAVRMCNHRWIPPANASKFRANPPKLRNLTGPSRATHRAGHDDRVCCRCFNDR